MNTRAVSGFSGAVSQRARAKPSQPAILRSGVPGQEMGHRRFDNGAGLVLPVAARQHARHEWRHGLRDHRVGLAVVAFGQLQAERLDRTPCRIARPRREEVELRQRRALANRPLTGLRGQRQALCVVESGASRRVETER